MASGSGLIIAFVVAVWAAYFVPLALRRYDDASKNTTVESFGPLSRVIARRSAGRVDDIEDGVPGAAEPVKKIPTARVAPSIETTQPRVADKITTRAARVAARRRRRTLLTLIGLCVVVGILVAVAAVPRLTIAVPVVLIVAWLIACRIQVRGERGLGRIRTPHIPMPHIPTLHIPTLSGSLTMPAVVKKSKGRRPSEVVEDDEEKTIVVSGQFEDINPGRKHEMEDIPLEVDALDDQIVIAVPSISSSGEALWDPLPVTLPTYVTKPRAGRTVRTIDFNQAGAWTSGHIEGEDVELPQRKGGAGGQADTGSNGHSDEQRRAVGH